MQHAAVFWDNIAEKYAKSPIKDMEAYEDTLERTRSYLTDTDHLLELGCGTGSTALLLAHNVAQLTASDLSGNMIRIAKKKLLEQDVSNVSFVTSDLFGSALDETSYDVVLALNLIHLLEETPAVMKRINDLVKPGGLFISKTFCNLGKNMPFKLRLMLMALPLAQLLGKAPVVNIMETHDLERHIMDAGFTIIEAGSHPNSPPNRYIVAKKLP